jgi:hypothetical protein
MSSSGGRRHRPYARSVLVGLVVTASTTSADLATYVGHLDFSKLGMFGLAGLFAAAVIHLTSSRDGGQGSGSGDDLQAELASGLSKKMAH